MRTDEAFKWNKRASALYALGAWTMFGSLAVYAYFHKGPLVTGKPVEDEDNPNVHKYKTAHTTTTVVYRGDFVPYSTRLFNYFRGPTESSPAVLEDQKNDN